jgi:hypothetical protein
MNGFVAPATYKRSIISLFGLLNDLAIKIAKSPLEFVEFRLAP